LWCCRSGLGSGRNRSRGLGGNRTQGCQHRSDGHPRALSDQQLVDHAVLEDLDLNLGFARVDDGDEIAAPDDVAGLDVPLQ
jgi:hypothetical protein